MDEITTPRPEAAPMAEALPPAPPPADPVAAAPDVDGAAPASILAIPIGLQLVFTTLRVPVSRLMELTPGAEIDIGDIGATVQILANGTPFASGELFVIDEAARRLGVRILRLSGGAVGLGA